MTAGTVGPAGSPDSVVPSNVTASSDAPVPPTPPVDVAAEASPVPEKVAEPVIATGVVAAGSGAPSGTVGVEPALPVSDIAVNPASIPSSDGVSPVPAEPAPVTPVTEVPVATSAPTIESAPAVTAVEAVITPSGEETPALTTVTTVNPAPVESTETSTAQIPTADTTYKLSEISTNGIKREDWVLQQKPDSYTLQISSVTEENDLVKFLQGHGIEDNSAYIQVMIDGVTRYNAIYGVYSTYAEAEQALAGLPDSLRQVRPWIRNFGILQKMVN